MLMCAYVCIYDIFCLFTRFKDAGFLGGGDEDLGLVSLRQASPAPMEITTTQVLFAK